MKNLIAFIYGHESLLQHTQLSFNEKQSLTTMGEKKNMLHCLALDSDPLYSPPPFCQVTNKTSKHFIYLNSQRHRGAYFSRFSTYSTTKK